MGAAQGNCLEKKKKKNTKEQQQQQQNPKNKKKKKEIKDDVPLLEERDLPFWILHPFLSRCCVTWD